MLQDGHALVADFGIAKVISDTASDTLTQVGMSVGTPPYMSPEQAVGQPVHRACFWRGVRLVAARARAPTSPERGAWRIRGQWPVLHCKRRCASARGTRARGGRRPAACKPRRHFQRPARAHRRYGRCACRGEACAGVDPDSFTAAYGRALALTTSDDPEDLLTAIATVNEALATFGRHPLFIPFLVRAYLEHGDARREEAAYMELQARPEIDAVQRSTLVLAAANLGRHDEAIGYALESVERCDELNPIWTRLPFATDPIRAHPRYPELLRAMGL